MVTESPGVRLRGAPHRQRQLARVLHLVDLLAPLRNGATLSELRHDLHDVVGVPVCERTVRRDLIVLQDLGMVSRRADGRWVWSNRRAVSHAIRAEASRFSESDLGVA